MEVQKKESKTIHPSRSSKIIEWLVKATLPASGDSPSRSTVFAPFNSCFAALPLASVSVGDIVAKCEFPAHAVVMRRSLSLAMQA